MGPLLQYLCIYISINTESSIHISEESWFLSKLITRCLIIPFLGLSLISSEIKTKNSYLGKTEFIKMCCIATSVMYFCLLIGNFFISICNNTTSTQYYHDPLHILIGTVIVSPIAEELVYRKIILGYLLSCDEWCAVIYSAELFGLMHLNLVQLVYAFPVGILLGYIYIQSGGKIVACIAMHSYLNFIFYFLPISLHNFKFAQMVYVGIMAFLLILGLIFSRKFFHIKYLKKFVISVNEIFHSLTIKIFVFFSIFIMIIFFLQ